MKVKEYYNDDPVNKSCYTYTKLNRYYIFQKEDDSKNNIVEKYKYTKK